MASSKDKWASASLSGFPIEELIAQPLEAVARAQAGMAAQQLRSLLKLCFRKESDGVYSPVMLRMMLTRAVLVPGDGPDGQAELRQIETTFHVPLISIISVSSLGVEDVNIDFAVEVTAQYSQESSELGAGTAGDGNPIPEIAQRASKKAVTLGRIAKRVGGGQQEVPEETGHASAWSVNGEATYNIDVAAGPLPLAKGLLVIIDAYTDSIDPVKMPQEKQEPMK